MSQGELKFDGRVALVTGAGRGMGYHHALILAQRGATVVVNDVNSENVTKAVDQMTKEGLKASSAISDISKPENCRKIVSDIIAKHKRLDILVNNAGIPMPKSFQNYNEEDYLRSIGVNLHGPWFLTQSAWPHMIKQGYGRVIMISSGSIFGMLNNAAYTTAKAGVMGLGLNLAHEGRQHRINVNVMDVAAGTEMVIDSMPDTPLRKFMVEQCPPTVPANLMAWLAHESCKTTGRFVVGGGQGFGSYYFGGVHGYSSKEKLSPEIVRDNWEKILDRDGGRLIDSAQDVTVLVAGRFGLESFSLDDSVPQ